MSWFTTMGVVDLRCWRDRFESSGTQRMTRSPERGGSEGSEGRRMRRKMATQAEVLSLTEEAQGDVEARALVLVYVGIRGLEKEGGVCIVDGEARQSRGAVVEDAALLCPSSP